MSTDSAKGEELKRIRKVADMLCTCHAVLRDRLAFRALLLDIFTLALSTSVVALAFVSPEIARRFTPFGWNVEIWLGTLSAGTFFLTLVQLKTDWKSGSDAHRRTLDLYVEVKREAGYLIASANFDEENYRRVLARYDLASAVGVEVPEKNFLKLKRQHRLKILVSKHLDEAPGTSIPLFRARLWLRDNRFWKSDDNKDY
jgi:hypothetical protein